MDPTAISERLNAALVALLGLRVLEARPDRVTAQLAIGRAGLAPVRAAEAHQGRAGASQPADTAHQSARAFKAAEKEISPPITGAFQPEERG